MVEMKKINDQEEAMEVNPSHPGLPTDQMMDPSNEATASAPVPLQVADEPVAAVPAQRVEEQAGQAELPRQHRTARSSLSFPVKDEEDDPYLSKSTRERKERRRGRGQGRTVRPLRTLIPRESDEIVASAITPSAAPPQDLLPPMAMSMSMPMTMAATNPGAPNLTLACMAELNKVLNMLNSWEKEKVDSISSLINQIKKVD